MTSTIPYVDLSRQHEPIKEEILEAWERCLNESAFILGKYVQDFEAAYAKNTESKHAIGVNNGTTALHLAVQALGIKPGDEVITTPFTFAASAWGISYVGAKPVFVDIDPENYTISPEAIEDAITDKTKAILVVHLYGHPCDMDPIMDIARHYNLRVIEDAAQAHGARYKNRPIGSFGDLTTYSFFPTKNLGACGEAGAVTTNDDELAEKVRLLRNHGSRERYKYAEVGYNYRMSGLQGATLGVKLKYLDQWNLERMRLAANYNSMLEGLDLKLPLESHWAESVYHLYTVATPYRDELVKSFQENNIGHSTHYAVPMHLQECYKELGYREGDLPFSEQFSNEVVNLPLFPGLKTAEMERVVDAIKQAHAVVS